MRFRIASPCFGSPSGSSFLDVLVMTDDEISREYFDQMALYLGRMVIACSIMENDLTKALAEIMNLNEVQERTLVRPMPTNTKVSLLNRLSVDYLKNPERERIKKITNAIKVAAEKRNDLIHGDYVHTPDKKAAIVSYSGAARIRGNPVRWTPGDLNVLIREMGRLCEELASLRPLFPVLEKVPTMPRSASNTHHKREP